MTRRKGKRLESARRALKVSAEQSHSMGKCPGCGKQAYPSKSAARAVARQASPGVQIRVYQCKSDPRWWHQTSQPARETEQWRGEIAFRSGGFAITQAEAEVARNYVAAVVQGTGDGPTWAQLAEVMGWPAKMMPALMKTLARRGWLYYTRTPRSLRPGPREERETS